MNKLVQKCIASLLALMLVPSFAMAAATRFTSPNFGIESVIFGGTGVLRSADAGQPPVITSGPTTSNITSSSVTISWTTNKASNSVVFLGTTSGNYTIQTGDIANAIFVNHVVTVSSLQRGTQYFYKVRSTDTSGNMVESAEDSFTTDPGDITAPVITAGPNFARNSASLITVTWETNEPASSLVDYGIDSVTQNTVGQADELTLFHQVQVSGLQSAQVYQMRVRSRDALGNTVTSSTSNVETLQAPNITSLTISDITLNSALVEWQTTNPSTTVINYGTQSGSYSDTISDTTSLTSNHLVRLSSLQSGTTYYLRISGTDASGNRITSDEYTFKTVVLPTITDLALKEVTSNSATLTWVSTSEIDEFLRYEITKSDDASLVAKKFTAGNDVLVVAHEFKLTDLESGTEYSLTVLGKDVFGNQATAAPITFTTLPDHEPPLIENVRTDTTVDLGSRQSVQVLISFGLSEMGLAAIEYGEGADGDYTKTIETDTEYSRNKFMVIPGLRPGDTYHFRIVARDRQGNIAESADYLVLAPAQRLSLFDLIAKELSDNLGWLTRVGQ